MDTIPSCDYDTVIIENRLGDGSLVWTAIHPDLLGCNASGRGQEEALANLAKAREAWLKVAAEVGEEIPTPPDNPMIQTQYLPMVAAARSTAGSGTESEEEELQAVA